MYTYRSYKYPYRESSIYATVLFGWFLHSFHIWMSEPVRQGANPSDSRRYRADLQCSMAGPGAEDR